MNKEQWEIVCGDIMLFNSLVHSEEFKKKEEYTDLCYNLVQEESNETVKAFKELGWGDADEDPKCSIDYLDGLCDCVVTGVQLIAAITPSQLEWSYIGKYLTKDETGKEPYCEGIKNFLLSIVVDAILEAQYYGCDMVGAMCEVSRSNLSKVPLLSDVTTYYATLSGYACEKACEWIELNRGYGKITYTTTLDKNGDNRVIFKDCLGKVMKWECFSEPSLEQYLGV